MAAQQHVNAMVQHCLQLIEETGDPNIAIEMMKLDTIEKSIVVKNLEQMFAEPKPAPR